MSVQLQVDLNWGNVYFALNGTTIRYLRYILGFRMNLVVLLNLCVLRMLTVIFSTFIRAEKNCI